MFSERNQNVSSNSIDSMVSTGILLLFYGVFFNINRLTDSIMNTGSIRLLTFYELFRALIRCSTRVEDVHGVALVFVFLGIWKPEHRSLPPTRPWPCLWSEINHGAAQAIGSVWVFFLFLQQHGFSEASFYQNRFFMSFINTNMEISIRDLSLHWCLGKESFFWSNPCFSQNSSRDLVSRTHFVFPQN